MQLELYGRTISDWEINATDIGDVDAHIENAYWDDTGKALTDDEYEQLHDVYWDEMYDLRCAKLL